jgi:hypothetical protein
MQAKLMNRSVEQAIAAIEALDLEPIKLRVMDAESGEGWTSEYADRIELGYRNYLRMLVKHPEDVEDIVVSKEVDEFWHAHILHTMKYTEDCERIFGKYLHHGPQSRELTPEDAAKRAASIDKTRRLYQEEIRIAQREMPFARLSLKAGEAAYCGAALRAEGAAYCGAIKAAYCGAALKKDKVAYCGAALKADEAAYCGAALRAEGAAYCGAIKAASREARVSS